MNGEDVVNEYLGGNNFGSKGQYGWDAGSRAVDGVYFLSLIPEGLTKK